MSVWWDEVADEDAYNSVNESPITILRHRSATRQCRCWNRRYRGVRLVCGRTWCLRRRLSIANAEALNKRIATSVPDGATTFGTATHISIRFFNPRRSRGELLWNKSPELIAREKSECRRVYHSHLNRRHMRQSPW